METNKQTPLKLFNMPQHFVIPLFQRAYVWKQEEQWEPLWADVRRVAEGRVNEPQRAEQHFLGAVVLQADEPGTANLPVWNVIDGQQRLTTLQLLTDAAGAVLEQAGFPRLSSQLEALTHNSVNYVPEGQSQLKLWHLNGDRNAFLEVMSAEPPVDYSTLQDPDCLISQAHKYFTGAVAQWLDRSQSDEIARKAEHLAQVLAGDLQLVTIELSASENSQEIFETLNARGTPLTAADLVRNFVFQRLTAEGADAQRAYREDWPFETKFWNRDVSVGRHTVSRSSLFLNQWLVSRTGAEISPESTFTWFKRYVERTPDHSMFELLALIGQQAADYEGWTESASRTSGRLDRTELAVYRMNVGGVQLLKPLLIWLHEPGRNLPVKVIDDVIDAAESWVTRRQLMRLTSSDLGRIVGELIKSLSAAPASELPERVRGYLSRLNVASTYWPGDDDLRSVLLTEAFYRRYSRPRLRSYLEAIEDAYRAETGQPQVERVGFPIEHVLPQKWQETWAVPPGIGAEDERQARVHRLGNLTLLTGSLNSRLSNSAWPVKRRALLEHNTIKLTGRLIDLTDAKDWDESLIDQRTRDMVEVLLKVWPVPVGHQGRVIDPQAKSQDWVEIKHLIQAGLIEEGTTLTATHRDHGGVTATVVVGGQIELDGRRYNSPSGAAKQIRNRATNGWYFWSLSDGRRLRDVRTEFIDSTDSVGVTTPTSPA